jgi:hypothetical protein
MLPRLLCVCVLLGLAVSLAAPALAADAPAAPAVDQPTVETPTLACEGCRTAGPGRCPWGVLCPGAAATRPERVRVLNSILFWNICGQRVPQIVREATNCGERRWFFRRRQ